MAQDKRVTPLRYPGGKVKFSPYIHQVIQKNNLVGCRYAEPYAGGAGLALNLLYTGMASHISINDLDPAVYSFWYSVLNYTDELIQNITDVHVSMDEWYRQKDVLANHEQHSTLKLGFATFFLNRTNRSGILKGGVIGGKEQQGAYKLDARFGKPELIRRIKRIAEYKHNISLYNLDALDFIKVIDEENQRYCGVSKNLIYLDPPYYVKGQGLYRNFYEHHDHVEIMNLLKTVKSNWMVSYDSCSEIKDIYKGFGQDEYFLNYSAQDKRKGSEVMFFCDSLNHGF